ncbi:kinase-like domain-containing protein [Lipomyces oligophaga]|uniref:kinase-like domain-containing protein n=1 Tax=Lipomyces oligophaga TaxID=45792 RepID=UPI0034CDC655
MASPFNPSRNKIFASPGRSSDKRTSENSSIDSLSKGVNGLYMSNVGAYAKLAPFDENHDDITSVVKLDGKEALQSKYDQENSVDNVTVADLARIKNSLRKASNGLTPEELKKLNDPSVRRVVNAAQIYFLDYYFDLLSYVHNRNQRLQKFRQTTASLPPAEQQVQWKSYTGRERAYLRKRRTRLRYGDFDILTQVGQGGYGNVFLARKSDTKEICALKVVKKKIIFKLDEIRHVLTERDILTAANSPWLVKLLYAFQDPECIYLAMEYVPGGDYRTLLNSTRVLSPRHARFYITEMFCAVESLHKLGYTHRDLKPENFLIDATGHIKLTDFGLSSGSLSKERVESMRIKLDAMKGSTRMPHRTFSERQSLYRSLREKDLNYANSIVGSPDYMALEVLEGKKYDCTIDYWSLGCILFESLCSYPPFAGANISETYANVRCWKDVFRRPVYDNNQYAFSDRTWDLMTHLIAEPGRRLRTIQEVHAHKYFAEIDWTNVRRMQPPFIPQLDSDIDAGYFDDFTDKSNMAHYKEVHEKEAQLEMLADKDDVKRGAFVGFTFKHSKALSMMDEGKLNETSATRKIRSAIETAAAASDGNFQTMF